jgi:dipeptidyl aminopeptidase/acylaminoacyl peptidase
MKINACLFASFLLVSCTGKKEIPQYTIDQFYRNVNVSISAFSPDESKLLISSNETGVYNIFEIDIDDGSKRQITNSTTESCYAVDYVYSTGQVLYSADRGGNENSHIYLLNEDGTSTDLTPGDAVKASFSGWSDDKKTMYFVSNKRDQRFFDIYSMKVGDWKEEMIYQNDQGYEYSAFTRDRNIIALKKSLTSSVSQLFIFDRNAGKLTEVSEPGNPGAYNGSYFSNDNRFLHYTTDAGKEFDYIVRYEIATGNREVIYSVDWDASGPYFSRNEKYRLIAINEDGNTSFTVTDMTAGIDIPVQGQTSSSLLGLQIAESEKKMALQLGSSKTIGDVYLYDFASAVLKKLTSTMNPDISGDDLITAEVVRFKSYDSLDIPAIYFKPLNASRKNKVPALVYVHGGPGGQSKPDFSPLIQYLGNHGYAILAVNNRGSSGYGKTFFRMDDRNHGDKDLKDCVWGKKWLQNLDYIDSSRIGIVGGSYGGFMTMAAMTFMPDEFRVGVNFFGVTNWIRTLRSIPPYWASYRDALYNEMGNPFTADSMRLYNISPLFHAKNIRHPVMVLQGSNDPRVLQVESDEMVAAINANNVPVEYTIFPDEGHGFVKVENEKKAYTGVLAFLDKYLK